jgi:hypothetical protein
LPDDNAYDGWSAAEAAKASPRCPTCDTHDEVERVVVGTDKNQMRAWYCGAPFCHTMFQPGNVQSDKLRTVYRKSYTTLRNYLAKHPERRQDETDRVLAREPLETERGVA